MPNLATVAEALATAALLFWLLLCRRVWRTWFTPAHSYVIHGPRRYAEIPAVGEQVTTTDRATITCWFFRGRLPAALVVCGGYRCFPEETMPLAADLHQAGFNIVLMSWRGCGLNDSAQVTFGVREPDDLAAAVNAARVRFPGTRVGVVGLSFGASMGVICAADGHPIDALWVDGPFRDPISVMEDGVRRRVRIWGGIGVWPVAVYLFLRHRVRVWRVRTEPAAHRICHIPMRILMYRGDGLLPEHRSRELADAAGWAGQVQWADGGHASAYDRDPRRYIDACVTFFESALDVGDGLRDWRAAREDQAVAPTS